MILFIKRDWGSKGVCSYIYIRQKMYRKWVRRRDGGLFIVIIFQEVMGGLRGEEGFLYFFWNMFEMFVARMELL